MSLTEHDHPPGSRSVVAGRISSSEAGRIEFVDHRHRAAESTLERFVSEAISDLEDKVAEESDARGLDNDRLFDELMDILRKR